MVSHAAAPPESHPRPGDESDPGLRHLAGVIEHAAHLLPAQGPITVFIHHNTLHAFEDLPFTEAVKRGARVFGCQPYLGEDRYRAELARGRIRFGELQEELERDLGDRAGASLPGFGTRFDLRLAMLVYPLRTGPTEELVWFVAEAEAMRRVRPEVSSAVRARLIAETRRWVLRDLRAFDGGSGGDGRRGHEGVAELLDRFGESALEGWSDEDWERFTLQALWRVCRDGVRGAPQFTAPPAGPVRHRNLLLEASGVDSDTPVHDVLTRFCAAYLDQGLAGWPLPCRDEGFARAFCSLYGGPGGPAWRWARGLGGELARLGGGGVTPLGSVRESLEALGVPEGEWEEFLSATLLALRGWAGMLRQIEERGDRVVHPVPVGSLTEFLAVRLLLDRASLAHSAREALGYDGPLSGLRGFASGRVRAHWPPSDEQRAFPVFQLAQVLGIPPDVLSRMRPGEWASVLEEVESFTGLERRRVFHLAYERRLYMQTLDAVALHALAPAPTPIAPRFQAVFCIDDREESLRRHIEELAPDAVTYATAGYFSVPMYYRGAADAHFVPLCPPVVRPARWVAEGAVDPRGGPTLRARARRALGIATRQFHLGSRSFWLGALLSTAVGVLASVPLVARTLFPRMTSRVRSTFGRIVHRGPRTRLRLERAGPAPGPEGDGLGFDVGEMTDIAEKVLRELGVTSGFARLVLALGHGSTSANNPHASAYDCGACGGAKGGPSGRAFAQMLNDPRVRAGLAGRGIVVPETTAFVGGMHNTSLDEVTYFDLDLLTETHRAEFEGVRAVIERALERNAHERCRRFQSAPLTLTFPGARQQAEARAADLAQVRPEWGHMTNAVSIVGRRDFTRGLFLDRRAFLTSYDPTRDDPELTVLNRVLSAVFPVCAGISLEYYFSAVDNDRLGAGTKLPHNVTSLVGVMDGAASDLRTGLPWQMIEFHEPVRLLKVVEATPEAMLRIVNRNQVVGRLVRNGWVRLAVIHPETREVRVYQEGEFLPYQPQATDLPRVASSADWYRGWRDHLEFAEVGPSTGGQGGER